MGFEQVCGYFAKRLKATDIAVLREWQRRSLARPSAPVAVIGIQQTKSEEGALWQYIGQFPNASNGEIEERYGRRFEITLYVDFYAPPNMAGQLQKCCERLEEIFLSPSPDALCPMSVQRGEITADSDVGALKCRCTLLCGAYYTAAADEDSMLLRDFTLKGVVK